MRLLLTCTREAHEKLQQMLEENTFPPQFAHLIQSIEPTGRDHETLVEPDKVPARLVEKVQEALQLSYLGHSRLALRKLNHLTYMLSLDGNTDTSAVLYYSALGKVHLDLREVAQSRRYLERAIEECRKLFPVRLTLQEPPADSLLESLNVERRRLLLQLYNNIGEWHHVTGNLEKAKLIHNTVFAARKRFLPQDVNDILVSLNNLAEVLRKLGQRRTAQTMHKSAYDERRHTLGAHQLDTLISLWNLILTHDELTDFSMANALQGELVAQLNAKESLNPVEQLLRTYVERRAATASASAGVNSNVMYLGPTHDE